MSVNGKRRVHRVRRRLASGELRTHFYAWRGGPPLPGPEGSAEFERSYQAAIATFGDFEAPRRSCARRTAATQIVDGARRRAVGHGVACTIDPAWVEAQLKMQKDRCAVSGIAFRYSPSAGVGRFRRNPFLPSLDRIERTTGYVPGNVRIVLLAVNYGINEWGEPTYRTICESVARSSQDRCPSPPPAPPSQPSPT